MSIVQQTWGKLMMIDNHQVSDLIITKLVLEEKIQILLDIDEVMVNELLNSKV